MRIEIREMTPGDIEGVARVRIQGWRHAYRGLVPQDYLDGMRPELFAAMLRAAAPGEPADRVHLVADARGTGVIGWAHPGAYRPDEHVDERPGRPQEEAGQGSYGELYALYLVPEFIGTGVGRALLDSSLRWLAGQGHRRLRLWVLRDNAMGRRFYDRVGLVADGAVRTDAIAGMPVNEVRYAAALDAEGRVLARRGATLGDPA
ncbi:GNAT family N-acetyltransferase [Streptomyces johnsoniae]|uniref:GNAT family N-acetyltransferase n=1 Tax=Streptomyces johnsoniae TaxID=3075532 RepID=A0ABU2RZV0_9ACTN|nr:GNAT family N-acetyltransferase [Streptomyces sp. DSM 41886]MDT0442286.1 GNAT family N-acetyltransferase [Streptomyces sp. DSM 41886]